MADVSQETRKLAQFPVREEEFRTDWVPPVQLQLVRGLFDQFLEGLSSALPAYLSPPMEVRFVNATQEPLSKAIGQLEGECAISLAVKPFEPCLRLVLGTAFACAALESILGAPAEAARSPRKSLTDLDLQVLREFNESITKELKAAWQPTFRQPVTLVSTELVAGLDAARLENQNSVVLSAEVTSLGCTDSIKLIVPSILLRLLSKPPNENEADALAQSLAAVSLEVEAVLQGGDIQVRDLLALQPGKILKLPQKDQESVQCLVNGVAKFRGELVTSSSSLGLQIQAPAPSQPGA